MIPVAFWWIGSEAADRNLLGRVLRDTEATFEIEVQHHPAVARPTDAFDPRRQQHLSTRILKWLVERHPNPNGKVVGITDVDLFIPILTFVYGEAQLGGSAAVVSMARLVPENGTADREAILASRLAKECVHELGHTFGLIHCHRPRCVMARSVNVAQVDAKHTALCNDCWVRFRELRRGEQVSHE